MKMIEKETNVSFRVTFTEDMNFTTQEWAQIEKCLGENYGSIPVCVRDDETERLTPNPVFWLVVQRIKTNPFEFVDELGFDIVE